MVVLLVPRANEHELYISSQCAATGGPRVWFSSTGSVIGLM